jgi:hypothetical protein
MTQKPTRSMRMLDGLVVFFTDKLCELTGEGEGYGHIERRRICEKRVWGAQLFNTQSYGPDVYCIAVYHEIKSILDDDEESILDDTLRAEVDKQIQEMLNKIDTTLSKIILKGDKTTDRPIEELTKKWAGKEAYVDDVVAQNAYEGYSRFPSAFDFDPSDLNFASSFGMAPRHFTRSPMETRPWKAEPEEEEPEVSETEAYWLDITDEAREVMLDKNDDYGEVWKEMLPTSLVDEILIKAKRSRNLMQKHYAGEEAKVSEGILSELRDIINYCVFAHYAWSKVLEEGGDDNE